LAILVQTYYSRRVPTLIGSAGGDGENAHVDMFVEVIIKLISHHRHRSLNVLSIYAEVPRGFVREKLDNGSINLVAELSLNSSARTLKIQHVSWRRWDTNRISRRCSIIQTSIS
jgi:hypothetical protein